MRKSSWIQRHLDGHAISVLMALFALTLSEIAYNRQRDKTSSDLDESLETESTTIHQLQGGAEAPFGYGDNAYDYYHRANAVHSADRYFSLSKNKEMAEALIQQASESSSTTTSSISSTSEPVVAIDSFPPKPSSFEQQQQQGEGMIRDARLQFLKTILQKIKQHAEDMGFDGTMQVSVIEMEPQTDEQFSPFGGQHLNQQHQIPRDNSSNNQQQQAPKSDSFMDGFGEYHQPTFMQNNQVVEQNRANRIGGPFRGGWPREEDNNNQQQQQPQQSHNGEFGMSLACNGPAPTATPSAPNLFSTL
uniref:Uncharacterized protein n=1 Tax=Ditylenchus dipsaci TaxID=166011 RepID=A0A915DIL8_9BILA